jgi:hypothetical protein
MQGTQIQGTFWREAAERYDEQMREGAVYILRKFQVGYGLCRGQVCWGCCAS